MLQDIWVGNIQFFLLLSQQPILDFLYKSGYGRLLKRTMSCCLQCGNFGFRTRPGLAYNPFLLFSHSRSCQKLKYNFWVPSHSLLPYQHVAILQSFSPQERDLLFCPPPLQTKFSGKRGLRSWGAYMRKSRVSGDNISANFLDFPPNFRLRTRF